MPLRFFQIFVIGLWAFFPFLPASEKKSWPLIQEISIADGEDGANGEPDLRYFGFGKHSFQFKVDAGPDTKDDSDRTRAVELIGEENNRTIKLKAPKGAVWLLSDVWATPDFRLVLWRGRDSNKEFWQVVKTSPCELLGMFPGKTFSIKNKRISFSGEIPETLQPYFFPELALKKSTPNWRDAVGHVHMHRLENSRTWVSKALAKNSTNPESAAAQKIARELLAAPVFPIDAASLAGEWKVRSIQGSPGAHFAYPFFKARITTSESGLLIAKTSGSQRRSGMILPDQKLRSVFLGGKSMNDEPPKSYHGLDKIGSKEYIAPKDTDTFGTVERIGKNHLLMILDAKDTGEYELYELVREEKR